MRVALLFLLLGATSTLAQPPVVPTPQHLAWHRMQYYAFVHFNMNTFTDKEWGEGQESPKAFNPSALDCRQWARICKAAGMKGIILTAKHHDGFCLWPTAFSQHSVKNSPWRNGKGDVLRELSDACRAYGLKFGVYLSPWDRNHPLYGTPEYNEVFKNTLTEVLTRYGEVFEVWFDGANGEGPNGKKQVYDWPGFVGVVRKYQPKALIFSDAGPDVRWVGNERGFAAETNWATIDRDRFRPGDPTYPPFAAGSETGRFWVPAEVDVSIRPGWYYHPEEDDRVKSPDSLLHIWTNSVGRGSNLLLNIPVDRRGQIHPADSSSLLKFKALRDAAFGKNKAFNPTSKLTDGNPDTFLSSQETTGTFTVDLGKTQPVRAVQVQEAIRQGQRVRAFRVEVFDAAKKAFVEVASGTTIGPQRILTFPEVATRRLRVVVTDAKNGFALAEVSVF